MLTFRLFWRKNYCGFVLGNHWKNWASFYSKSDHTVPKSFRTFIILCFLPFIKNLLRICRRASEFTDWLTIVTSSSDVVAATLQTWEDEILTAKLSCCVLQLFGQTKRASLRLDQASFKLVIVINHPNIITMNLGRLVGIIIFTALMFWWDIIVGLPFIFFLWSIK